MRQSRVPNRRTSRPRPPAISRWTPPRRCPMPPQTTVPDTTAKAAEPKPSEAKPAETKPAEVVTAPAADPKANDATTNDTATVTPAAPPPATAAAPAAEPAKEPVKAASNVPAADQPVADKLREMLGGKSLRTSTARPSALRSRSSTSRANTRRVWTQAGKLTDSGKGVIARLKDAASEGLNPADYPVPDFAAATSPDALADAELKLDRQHAGLCAPGAERPDALVAGLRRHPLSRASDRSGRSAGQHLDRQGRLRRARRLQPAAQALSRTQGQARRIARPGRRTGDPDRRRPGSCLQGRHQEAAGGCAGRSARAATARQARHLREPRRRALRRQGRRGRAQIPGERRAQGHRRARRPHRQGDQQPEARPADRHRHRQHGALALAAAPARRVVARQRLCHPQHPRLYAEGDAERRARSGPPAW